MHPVGDSIHECLRAHIVYAVSNNKSDQSSGVFYNRKREIDQGEKTGEDIRQTDRQIWTASERNPNEQWLC